MKVFSSPRPTAAAAAVLTVGARRPGGFSVTPWNGCVGKTRSFSLGFCRGQRFLSRLSVFTPAKDACPPPSPTITGVSKAALAFHVPQGAPCLSVNHYR